LGGRAAPPVAAVVAHVVAYARCRKGEVEDEDGAAEHHGYGGRRSGWWQATAGGRDRDRYIDRFLEEKTHAG
jgi:hypothetical protein